MTTKTAPKPGYLTTELYVTLAVMLCALVLALASKIDGAVALGAVTAASAAYTVSRGIAKS